MPLIKPRTRGKQVVRRIVRLDRESNETLFAYAHFLGESTDYVLNEVIDTMLAKDKEFLNWRTEHAESFVPPAPAPQSPRRRRAARRADAAATSPKTAEELTPARS
jgi:hypothetical protein